MIHTWANIALVFLVLLSLIAWAIPLVLLLFSLRGMHRAHRQIDSLMPHAQARARQVISLVEGGSYTVARLIIRAHTWVACVQAIARALRGGLARSSPSTDGHDEVNS